MSIAIRRHHRKRLMKKRKNHYGGTDLTGREKCVWIGRLAATATLCSGPCCGNGRKWYGTRTMQEEKFEIYCKAED